ncbi:MAG: 5'-3' exonuclease H3TH domain-containing protein [Candidatus Dasytiphilus stammeri]
MHNYKLQITSGYLPNKSLIIIDGTSYLYRAYYALPMLINSQGEPTGAIYGICKMFSSLLKQYKPSHMVVVFDVRGKNFRNYLFPAYKLNRQPMPEPLSVQIKPIYGILRAMGIYTMAAVSGFEADDIIGTLSQQLSKQGYMVLISSIDKDIAQLVTSNILILNKMKILGPQEIQDKYGVPPSLIIDLIALIGDSCDNIPGVPGIGVKIAQKLLLEIGNLNKILSHINKIKNMSFRSAKLIAANLEKHKYLTMIYRKLATIKTDIELKVSYDELAIKAPDIDKLVFLFKHYELKQLIPKSKISILKCYKNN